ncbi:hypothetical protein OCOJLMKI_3322 [Methylobacterium iners]|uniref:Uncharacterized protein n=1 Tax=Methylobacterium iners TaxID=418707 RepID=A0ABQ4S2F5_9HYPH|nr:hypothetical protein OCOJLMKI_3322 [Methylobacterium iners]
MDLEHAKNGQAGPHSTRRWQLARPNLFPRQADERERHCAGTGKPCTQFKFTQGLDELWPITAFACLGFFVEQDDQLIQIRAAWIGRRERHGDFPSFAVPKYSRFRDLHTNYVVF